VKVALVSSGPPTFWNSQAGIEFRRWLTAANNPSLSPNTFAVLAHCPKPTYSLDKEVESCNLLVLLGTNAWKSYKLSGLATQYVLFPMPSPVARLNAPAFSQESVELQIEKLRAVAKLITT
jgi:uracil-DNA glycosylase